MIWYIVPGLVLAVMVAAASLVGYILSKVKNID